ncbi:MAG TPA: YfiR family protein [Thermoanaerobaculia bacterium]|nr:YfiR family protein [Thermoanaerobaculia bacterium]
MLLAVIAVGSGTARAETAPAESRIKTEFLLHFVQFVEWPKSVLPPGAPIVIGIVGSDPFGRAIEELTGKRANGHTLVIRRLRWNDVLTGCHVVFFSSREGEHLAVVLAATRGRSILTVGDAGHFVTRGGVIELVASQGGIDFDVNTEAAAQAHLRISSKLLQVAHALRGTTEGR